MADGERGDYDPAAYAPVAVTVDLVVFAIKHGALQVLLIERGINPFRGAWALPGGFLLPGEDLRAAAGRELEEETGVETSEVYMEQLHTYGAPGRDPRMRVVTVVYWAACASLPQPVGGSDAALAALVPMAEIRGRDFRLAFDHKRIVVDAYQRLQSCLETTTVASRFCGPRFTITELRSVYETIWETELDPGNFQRKVRDNECFSKVGVRAPVSRPEVFSARLSPPPPRIEIKLARFAAPPPDPAPALSPSPSLSQPRGGRPPSLWTASESVTSLNSPIFRSGRRRMRR